MIHSADMIAKRAVEEKENPGLTIFALNEFENQPKSLGMLACATIAPGGSVEYHVHEGECEYTTFFPDVGSIMITATLCRWKPEILLSPETARDMG